MHDLATRDDSKLLARWAREGSEDAFAEIVNHYQRLVLGAAHRRTGDPELARDVAQAAPEMLIIVREIPKLERDSVKGARFYATMFGEVMGFDEPARKTMEQDDCDGARKAFP
jgi:hypothetical protein